MSPKPYPSSELSEIRVTGVSENTREALLNIAKNTGVSISNLLRPKLTEIANSYPELMKLPPRKD